MFGKATITLGIGPHSSSTYFESFWFSYYIYYFCSGALRWVTERQKCRQWFRHISSKRKHTDRIQPTLGSVYSSETNASHSARMMMHLECHWPESLSERNPALCGSPPVIIPSPITSLPDTSNTCTFHRLSATTFSSCFTSSNDFRYLGQVFTAWLPFLSPIESTEWVFRHRKHDNKRDNFPCTLKLANYLYKRRHKLCVTYNL